MRTESIKPSRHITVMAEDTKTARPTLPFQSNEKLSTFTSWVSNTHTVDMVERKKLVGIFTAAYTFVAVVIKSFKAHTNTLLSAPRIFGFSLTRRAPAARLITLSNSTV